MDSASKASTYHQFRHIENLGKNHELVIFIYLKYAYSVIITSDIQRFRYVVLYFVYGGPI